METRSFRCSLPDYSQGRVEQGRLLVETGKEEAEAFTFHIDGIDHEAGKARLIGNAGADDLTVVGSMSSVSFIERTPSGALNITTIYAWRDSMDRFHAAHSRHIALLGPYPSQRYGYCEVWH